MSEQPVCVHGRTEHCWHMIQQGTTWSPTIGVSPTWPVNSNWTYIQPTQQYRCCHCGVYSTHNYSGHGPHLPESGWTITTTDFIYGQSDTQSDSSDD